MEIIIALVILFLVLALIFCLTSIKYVKPHNILIIERFNKFNRTVISKTVLIPFIEKIKLTLPLDAQKIELPPQSIITTDNTIINIGTIITYQITDPVKATYEMESVQRGIELMTNKMIHEILEKMDYDTAINSKKEIRNNVKNILTEAVVTWGITIWEFEFSTFAKNI